MMDFSAIYREKVAVTFFLDLPCICTQNRSGELLTLVSFAY